MAPPDKLRETHKTNVTHKLFTMGLVFLRRHKRERIAGKNRAQDFYALPKLFMKIA